MDQYYLWLIGFSVRRLGYKIYVASHLKNLTSLRYNLVKLNGCASFSQFNDQNVSKY